MYLHALCEGAEIEGHAGFDSGVSDRGQILDEGTRNLIHMAAGYADDLFGGKNRPPPQRSGFSQHITDLNSVSRLDVRELRGEGFSCATERASGLGELRNPPRYASHGRTDRSPDWRSNRTSDSGSCDFGKVDSRR